MVENPKPKIPRLVLLVAPVVLVVAVLAGFWIRQHHELPAPTYVGTTTCASCHQDAYDNWLQSDHRHAMEIPDAQSVLGNFNDARFDYFGTPSRFSTEGGKYYVETDNAAGKLEKFQVAYTFGHYPLQQYLIAFPDGRMQALSISWDSRPAAAGGQRWFHLYPEQQVTHEDPLHWSGAFQNWNSRCASCHSTNLVKNYAPDTDRYATQWQELTVGCEACHGPGSQHVAWANGRDALPGKGLLTDLRKTWEPHDGERPIPQLPAATLSAQLQVCSACHSRRAELQQPDLAAPYFDNYSLSPLLDGRYFADGQIHDEVYETGSFLQSRMHQNHVSCSNCHEPHSARLRRAGNDVCLQCHQAPRYQDEQHFFHKAGSPGAQCVNCHMPERTYMGVDVRRDHSFRVPDPEASLRNGVPDACTQCHKDRGERWAADVIAKRTGRRQPWYAHTALLAAARANDATVLTGLLAYAADSSRPAMLRATALLESARFASAAQLAAVDSALRSADPLVRVGAVAALGGAQLPQQLQHLQPLLADPVKAVRMAVAQQLSQVPLARAPAEVQDALGRLFDEYRASLLYNADMPESLSNLALHQAAQGEVAAAEQSLRKALQLAPRYLPAMLNLSDIYRATSRDEAGETLLRAAMAAYPESPDARHMLGLLYVRTGRTPASVPLFEAASRMAPGNAQYALVYAMALAETGRKAAGIRVLRQAAQRFPDNAMLQQTLEAYTSP